MADILQAVFALLLVLGLISGCAVLLRRWQQGQFLPARFQLAARKQGNGIRIIDQTSLDPRRRMVLVANGTKRHLLILSQAGETVVENYTIDPDSTPDNFPDALEREKENKEA